MTDTAEKAASGALRPEASGDVLLAGVTVRGQGERLMKALRAAGAPGGTILPASGTAGSRISFLLGLGDARRDLLLSLVPGPRVSGVCAGAEALAGAGSLRGIVFTLQAARAAGEFFRAQSAPVTETETSSSADEPEDAGAPENSSPRGTEETVTMSSSSRPRHRLVCIIVTAGWSDDVMAAARAAGAGGGTVVHGRGTATDGDARFLGVSLVPERDVVLVLADTDTSEAVLAAVRALPCLSSPEGGGGIAFSLPVDAVIPLSDGKDLKKHGFFSGGNS